MKYIIVGLGSFGSSLGVALTSQGHEVIAIDSSMQKVEAYKELITHTICMDATDEYAVKGLPIVDTDIVVVAIGEDQGVQQAARHWTPAGIARAVEWIAQADAEVKGASRNPDFAVERAVIRVATGVRR